eukprot:scaffold40645_cov172-Skeletonema_dohrnii-CCMP3373.AAC.1
MNSLVELKAHSAAVEEEARVARRVREKLASGQCIICLDENPNISTLCCGQAIHHNCLTEWLSNQGTCIACRKAMPKIPRTLQRQDAPPPTNANASNDSANETTESTADTTSDNDVVQQQDSNDTTEDDTTDDTTSDDDVVQQDNNDTTEDTTDDTTSDDDVVVQQQADNNDTTEDTTDDTTEDTTDDTESADAAKFMANSIAVDTIASAIGTFSSLIKDV